MTWEKEKEGIAYLIALDPLIDETGESYIPLMYTFPLGDEMSVNQNSVLVRPFYKVLKEGKPMGTISYIFYQENEDYFILGSFIYTKRRLIFFPGVTDRRLMFTSEQGDMAARNQIVDHYSLESDLRTYHLTLEGKEIHGTKHPKMNTIRVKDDMFLWMCFGIKTAEMLEKAPKTQEIRLKGFNQVDIRRRSKLIEDARGECIFNVVKVKENPETEFYINIEIFVSSIQSRNYLPPENVYSVGLSLYDTVLKEDRKYIPTRLHYSLLKGYSGALWIRVTKLKGKLNNHIVYVFKS
jgi:hypothetical protein